MAVTVIKGSPEHRARVMRSIRSYCYEIRLLINTADHWNRLHQSEQPIDIGDLRQMLAEGEDMLAKDPGHGPIAPFTYLIGRGSKTPQ